MKTANLGRHANVGWAERSEAQQVRRRSTRALGLAAQPTGWGEWYVACGDSRSRL